MWVNSGEDKVTRESLRLTGEGRDVRNAIWNGRRVDLSAARNETVSFNIVIETPRVDLRNVVVRFDRLDGSDGQIVSKPMSPDDAWTDFLERPIELFHVGYLPIRGVSTLAYEHFDERHVPQRFRRPHDAQGYARGGWTDRPDHDRHYPDIAVPLSHKMPFTIRAGQNQSIWCDVYVPENLPAGDYRGEVSITADGISPLSFEVTLNVQAWALPNLPSARTMLYVSREDIHRRYTGHSFPEDDSPKDVPLARRVVDRHYQMAHRHRVSLIEEHVPVGIVRERLDDVMNGDLFTSGRGYDGPGVGVGNNVLAIGTYGTWPWKDGNRADMWRATDRWVRTIEQWDLQTPTDAFLYLADESDRYQELQTWASWAADNPGPGADLPTLATLPLPKAVDNVPALTIPCSTVAYGVREDYRKAWRDYQSDPTKKLYLYNGGRIGSGTMVIEDDGVAMRMLPWCQYKFAAHRWFIWQGTYYRNFQGNTGETRLFSNAHTFGGYDRIDPALGETGGNYNNGDGVLFYPGIDRVHPEESLGYEGPIASLRLKHWRRGLQDHEYLVRARTTHAEQVDELVGRMIPKVLWEVGVTDPADPTYVRGDISWSTEPDDWNAARMQLANWIAESSETVSPKP